LHQKQQRNGKQDFSFFYLYKKVGVNNGMSTPT